MIDIYRKLRDLLDPREQRRALLLLVMILVLALVETVRVASIVPFVAVLAEPEVVETNPYLAKAYEWLGFESTDTFLFFLGLVVFAIMLGTLGYTALTTWAMVRFTAMRNYRLSRKLFEVFLARRYEWFLKQHSADLSKSVLSEVGHVIGNALMPMMTLVTQGAIATCLIVLLLIADPILTVIISVALGGGYWVIYWLSRKFLSRIGAERVEANRQRYQISSEAFGGIKDIKALGLEKIFVRRFDKPAMRFVTRQAASELLGQLPQYGLQLLAFGIVLVIVWYQLMVRDNLAQALPVIALYALAGSRLTPAFHKIYQSLTKLRYGRPALDALHRDLTGGAGAASPVEPTAFTPLGLKKRLDLRDVSYRYPGSAVRALSDVSFSIPARCTIGLVGKTGAGKTTLVDVILGLLEAEAGNLLVDGTTISDGNRRAWQKSVGYVPQHIFLADDTIAANIAFGVAPQAIDMAAVERSARVANLHDFITGELEQGYQTLIGERGIRLSGGQRQRIGIARALYRDPDLLIMDEGTSALDNITERAVIDAVNNLSRRKTIILIAHRLTTVRNCDTIFLLDHGRLVASGPYDRLVDTDARFRAMATGSGDLDDGAHLDIRLSS